MSHSSHKYRCLSDNMKLSYNLGVFTGKPKGVKSALLFVYYKISCDEVIEGGGVICSFTEIS